MPTAALPRSIRDQATDVIAARLQCTSPEKRLADYEGAVVVAVLLDLEESFGILIEVDEALPHGTIASLLGVVAVKTCSRTPLPAGHTASLIDLAAARADRARRARPADVQPAPVEAAAEAASPPPVPAALPDPEPSRDLIPLLVAIYRTDAYARLLINLAAAFAVAGAAVGFVFWADLAG